MTWLILSNDIIGADFYKFSFFRFFFSEQSKPVYSIHVLKQILVVILSIQIHDCTTDFKPIEIALYCSGENFNIWILNNNKLFVLDI